MKIKEFADYLLANQIVPKQNLPYYQQWISRFLVFIGDPDDVEISGDAIRAFERHLGKRHQEWQIKQARESIRLYNYFLHKRKTADNLKPEKAAWKNAVEEMHRILRLKHRAYSTEQSYVGWLRKFCVYCNGKDPDTVTPQDAKDFLSYLAVEHTVSKSTRNQAFNALLFFYRHVLEQEINDFAGTVRAESRRKLPVVLTKPEVFQLFDHMQGEQKLAARIIYGCGLRVKELARLRVKDADFEMGSITVRSGKGDKDRVTVLPNSLKDDIQQQMDLVRLLYEQVRENDFAGVYLPHALEKKAKNKGMGWG